MLKTRGVMVFKQTWKPLRIAGLGLCAFLTALACERPQESDTATQANEAAPSQAFLKGQLHAHTGNSGDSQTPPADAARWYEEHGFDFVVFTDHNVITELDHDGSLLVIPGVELTLNLRDCSPPPPTGMACLLHMNAVFVEALGGTQARPISMPPPNTINRFDLYKASLDYGKSLGALVILNHPNFHRAADASLMTTLAASGLTFMEVANEAFDSNNTPIGGPSTEELWDAVLSAGHGMWGVATDDSHHYYDAISVGARGEDVFTGDRGFVMVRAEKTPTSIRTAMIAGDFYFSNGLLLEDVKTDAKRLYVHAGDEEAHIRFIGKGGRLLGEAQSQDAEFSLSNLERDGYVRAVIERDGLKAWTQPVRQ